MAMAELVRIHSLVLLNVSDQIVRKCGDFGILLGTRHHHDIIVNTLFEVIVVDGVLDTEFLGNRVGQFNTVLPHLSIVGLYHIGDINNVPNAVFSQLEQYVTQHGLPGDSLISTTFQRDMGHWVQQGHFQGQLPLASYFCSQKIPTVISSNSSERIATMTIINNADYSGSALKQGVSFAAHVNDISDAINQLHERMKAILNWIRRNDSDMELNKRIQINNQIVHLASKLKPFKHSSPDTLLRVHSSQLALLSDQLAALEAVKLQMSKNITRYAVNATNINSQWYSS